MTRPRLEEPVVAVLGKRGRFLVAEPLFERGGQRLTLDGKSGAVGDLVLVGGGKRGPRVLRRIGRPDVARHVVEGLMLDRGLRRSFPHKVEGEAADAAGVAPGLGRRADLTDLPTFTIDPTDAKDYDDAISARREGERVRLWVHIADVSAYVRPGTLLEREAFRRATSVYVPGAVEPMLPEALSNTACSLVPGRERPAVTVEMEMDGTDAVSVAFQRSLIRSDARLTYAHVDRVFAGEERAEEPWAEPLEAARAVASALRERRESRRSLEVDSVEPSFLFDDEGNVTGIVHDEQTESHRLIEELMILANEQVATYLSGRKLPTLYRVHERPEPQAIVALADKLASLDVPTPPLPRNMSPRQAADLAADISRHVAAHVRRTGRGRAGLTSLVLRSLKQAVYTPRNLGHSGLASTSYCHFTSPIRRYPDLVAHRALLAGLGLDDAAPRAAELTDAGVWASERERDAMKVERDADDVCRCFLLERRLFESGWEDAEFEGEIVGLIGAGAFVRFGEDGFEGFLPARRLPGEWWSLNETETALVGERSGRALRFGDSVGVRVERVEAPRGRVDLVPAG
ncbi:MAG: RNB domain-containing ribonuclease [Thermoleophilaceae bacterium]